MLTASSRIVSISVSLGGYKLKSKDLNSPISRGLYKEATNLT